MLVGWLFQTLAESGVGEFGAELEQSILAGFPPVLSSISLTGHPAGPSSLLSAPSPVPPHHALINHQHCAVVCTACCVKGKVTLRDPQPKAVLSYPCELYQTLQIPTNYSIQLNIFWECPMGVNLLLPPKYSNLVECNCISMCLSGSQPFARPLNRGRNMAMTTVGRLVPPTMAQRGHCTCWALCEAPHHSHKWDCTVPPLLQRPL